MTNCCSVSQIPSFWGGSFSFHRGEITQAPPIDTFLLGISLPVPARECLDEPGPNIRSVWMLLNFQWKSDGVDCGHAAILLFDIKRKLQIVFDPHTGNNVPNDIGIALCRRKFHQEYANVDAVDSMPADWRMSIQQRMQEVMHVDERGMCGILCLLVMVCCLRFGYLNPGHVATLITELMVNVQRQIGNRLISWYEHIRVINPDNIAQFREAVLPVSHAGRCRVYSRITTRVCSRPSCRNAGGRNLCWQHRHIILNRMAENMRCATDQEPCGEE